MFLATNITEVCANSRALELTCPGLCANQAIAGIGSRYAIYSQGMIAGEAALRLPSSFIRPASNLPSRPLGRLVGQCIAPSACVVPSDLLDTRTSACWYRIWQLCPAQGDDSVPRFTHWLLRLRCSWKRYAILPFIHGSIPLTVTHSIRRRGILHPGVQDSARHAHLHPHLRHLCDRAHIPHGRLDHPVLLWFSDSVQFCYRARAIRASGAFATCQSYGGAVGTAVDGRAHTERSSVVERGRGGSAASCEI